MAPQAGDLPVLFVARSLDPDDSIFRVTPWTLKGIGSDLRIIEKRNIAHYEMEMFDCNCDQINRDDAV